MGGFVYMPICSDGSYYIGSTSASLEKRMAEHQAGTFDGYTAHRRPVSLVFQQAFEHVEEAISAERQIKGWRRAKKEALIRGDYAALPPLSSRARDCGCGPP
jgi:putative endonuclease